MRQKQTFTHVVTDNHGHSRHFSSFIDAYNFAWSFCLNCSRDTEVYMISLRMGVVSRFVSDHRGHVSITNF